MFKIIKWYLLLTYSLTHSLTHLLTYLLRTKKILLEEGTNNLPLLTHIWGMISRHSETFYPYRHLLLPQIVTTLSKVGLASTNVPQDFRQMTLTLVDVIIGWEFYRIMKINTPVETASNNELKRDSTSVSESTDTANKKLKVDVDINIENPMSQPTSTSEGMTTASPRAMAVDNSFLANLPLLLANFVVRLAFKIIDTRVAGNNPKDVTTQKLYSRCMHLYKVTHSPTHSLTHLLTHSLTYSLTHSPTHSLTYSLTHLLTHSLTQVLIKIYPDVDLKVVFIDKELSVFAETFYKTRVTAGNYSLTYSPTHLLTHLLTHSPTHSLTYSPTHLLTYSPTYSLTYSLTHSQVIIVFQT